MKILEGLPEAHLLTPAQEARCGREKLVLHTMREAFVYARECCRASIPDDALLSLCYTALLASARRYKSAKGRFFPFCKVNIRGQISREWKRLNVVKHSDRHESLDIEPKAPEVEYAEPEFGLMAIHERLELIKPILAMLTRREQQIIELRYKSGFTFTKIGKLFGFSRQRIELTHRDALLKIKRELLRQGKL